MRDYGDLGLLVALSAAGSLGFAGAPCAWMMMQGFGNDTDTKGNSTCWMDLGGFLEQGTNDQGATSGAIGLAMVFVAAGAIVPMALIAMMRRCAKAGREKDEAGITKIYMSHCLSSFGDRMWQLAVPMIFMDLFRDTLLPTSVYTLIVYLSVCQFLPFLGAWVDRTERLTVQRTTLASENTSILMTSLIVCCAVLLDDNIGVGAVHLGDFWTALWFSFLVLFGCVGEVMNGARTTSLERDWVVVIAEEAAIPVSRLNTTMRRIDLLCLTVGPVPFAILYEMFGDTRRRVFFGALLLGTWNAISWPLETILLKQAYSFFPGLARKGHEHADGTKHSHASGHIPHSHIARACTDSRALRLSEDPFFDRRAGKSSQVAAENDYSEVEGSDEIHGHHGHSHHRHSHSSRRSHDHGVVEGVNVQAGNESAWRDFLQNGSVEDILRATFVVGYKENEQQRSGVYGSLFSGLLVYKSEMVFIASVAYTLLYMTVLDQGALITSYLQWADVPAYEFALGRSVGAVSGLIGTFLYPCLVSFMQGSVAAAGLLGIWLFWLTLLPGAVLIGLSAPPTAFANHAVVVCMALSRSWLWLFDLAITELCQRHVPEDKRAIFGSVQTSSYNFFFILVQIFSAVSPEPAQFRRLVLLSIAVVFAACVLYTLWYLSVFRRRETYETLELGGMGASHDEHAGNDEQQNHQRIDPANHAPSRDQRHREENNTDIDVAAPTSQLIQI